ncbi:MAG TPA: hypothetical protein VKY85_10185 [Candidatus Angelobacter sp.]|nr:hypothetical protein [Candidatus Angelobacter sp.]
MKRLLLVTAVLGGAALVPLAAQAQRGMSMGAHGGGVASGHASSGFAARPAGRMAAGGSFRPAGMHVVSSHARMSVPGQRAFSVRNRFAFNRFNRFNRFPRRHFFFGNQCFNTFGAGFGCANPFLAGGAGYPFYDPFFNDYSNAAPPPPQPAVEEGGSDNNRELASEVEGLSDEIQAMRDEGRARAEARNNAASKGSSQREEANTVLVFRDGRQLSVRNYAIADHTIWVLSNNSARKIPVSDLDVAATEQTNTNNGVEFRLPR